MQSCHCNCKRVVLAGNLTQLSDRCNPYLGAQAATEDCLLARIRLLQNITISYGPMRNVKIEEQWPFKTPKRRGLPYVRKLGSLNKSGERRLEFYEERAGIIYTRRLVYFTLYQTSFRKAKIPKRISRQSSSSTGLSRRRVNTITLYKF